MGAQMATIRWTAACILVGGVLYGLYGLVNPLLAPFLVWQLVSQLLGGAFLTVGATGLRVYLRDQTCPWVGQVG